MENKSYKLKYGDRYYCWRIDLYSIDMILQIEGWVLSVIDDHTKTVNDITKIKTLHSKLIGVMYATNYTGKN